MRANALNLLNAQLHVHHWRICQDERLVGTLGHGRDEVVIGGMESAEGGGEDV